MLENIKTFKITLLKKVIDADTIYKIESHENNYCLLSYNNNGKNTIEVPKQLIPFWAKNGDNLHYKNGKFNRDL